VIFPFGQGLDLPSETTSLFASTGRIMTDRAVWAQALTELGVVHGAPSVFAADEADQILDRYGDKPVNPFNAARLVAEYLERIDEIR
jgi:hypothetical protein